MEEGSFAVCGEVDEEGILGEGVWIVALVPGKASIGTKIMRKRTDRW